MSKKIIKIIIKPDVTKSRNLMHLDAVTKYPARVHNNKKAYNRNKIKDQARKAQV